MPGIRPLFARLRPLVLVLAALALTAPVAGQGTDGSLPDPISTRELMEWAGWLELSPSQRRALESAHDEYKLAFRALRDGDIAAFMSRASSMGGRMPKREQLDEMLDDLGTLQTKIKVLDDRLMDRMFPLLTEDQSGRLPRVRMKRERDRYASTQIQQMMMMSGRRHIDLSDQFRALDLDPDVLASVDPMMATYERRLTTELRKINKAVLGLYRDLFDAIEAAGFGDVDFADPDQDPEELKRFGETMQQVWVDLMQNIRELTADARELDQRTMQSVVTLLPPQPARTFRNQYYLAAYPELRFGLALGDAAWVTRLDEVDVLAGEQRTAALAIADEYDRKTEALLTQAIGLLEKQREGMTTIPPDFEKQREFAEKLGELQQEAAENLATAIATLTATLGEALVEEIQSALRAGPAESVLAEAPADEEDASAPWSGDPLLVSRITRRDVRSYGERLGLDTGERDVLAALHMDYVDAFKALPALTELRQTTAGMWQPEAQGADPDAGAEKMHRLRQQAVNAIRAADEAFFDEAGLVVPDDRQPVLSLLRKERAFTTYNRASAFAFGGQGNQAEASIDLLALAVEQPLTDDERARLRPALEGSASELLAAMRDRFTAQLDLQRASDQWTLRTRNQEAAGDVQVDWRAYQELIAPLSARVTATNRLLADRNRETITALVGQLPPASGQALRRAYDRQANPSVYEDPLAVDETLTRALALGDLTDGQREDLADVAASYRPEYDALSRRMADATPEGVDFANFEMTDWQAYQEKQRDIAKMRYDRDELSYRATARLRAILGEEQTRRIGGLPEPAAETDAFGVLAR